MKNSLTIAGKELAGYFLQPVAYVVMTVFLLLGGFFFFALLRYFEMTLAYSAAMQQNPEVLQQINLNERVIEPMLHNLAIVLVILVPAITMRTFAEEKRTGTYELLLTAPIRTGEIVAGKFIAAAAFMLIMIGLAGIFPLILVAFGNPEVGVMFAGYLGLAFLAISFVSIGLFTSSLTENQIIAAISCFGLLLLLFVISWPAQAGGSSYADLLRYLSLPDHFAQMLTGIIDTRDVVYFLSVIFVALFLTQRSVESARWREGRGADAAIGDALRNSRPGSPVIRAGRLFYRDRLPAVRVDQPGRRPLRDSPVDHVEPLRVVLDHDRTLGALRRQRRGLLDRVRRLAGRGKLYFVAPSPAARPDQRKGFQPVEPVDKRGQGSAEAAQALRLFRRR